MKIVEEYRVEIVAGENETLTHVFSRPTDIEEIRMDAELARLDLADTEAMERSGMNEAGDDLMKTHAAILAYHAAPEHQALMEFLVNIHHEFCAKVNGYESAEPSAAPLHHKLVATRGFFEAKKNFARAATTSAPPTAAGASAPAPERTDAAPTK